MRLLLTLILLAASGAGLAQSGPSTGATMRDGSQPTGTVLEPERRLQPELQPPPQNPQPFGASTGGVSGGAGGGPIQETGNYGNLGLGSPTPGQAGTGQRSLVQPDYQRQNDDPPFQRR
jgi:hypothetical protein